MPNQHDMSSHRSAFAGVPVATLKCGKEMCHAYSIKQLKLHVKVCKICKTEDMICFGSDQREAVSAKHLAQGGLSRSGRRAVKDKIKEIGFVNSMLSKET